MTRHIDALGSKSSYSKVVVSEKIDFDAGGQFSQKQDNQYVMDRRSMKNVQSDDAYAFTSDNVVDRSPAFRLNFPLDTDANGEYLIYKNETASTYTAGPDPVEPKLEVDGLHLVAFAASSKPTPISPAYIALLSQSVPLPKTLTITQLTPLLLQAGIDVPGTLTALQPVITPEDLTTLTKLASQPIALQYLDTFSGGDAVEPTTGAIVVVRNVVETVSATAAPEASQPIIDVLGAVSAGARGEGSARGPQRARDQPDPALPQRVLADRRVDQGHRGSGEGPEGQDRRSPRRPCRRCSSCSASSRVSPGWCCSSSALAARGGQAARWRRRKSIVRCHASSAAAES